MVRLRDVLPSDLPLHFEQQRDPASSAMAVVPPRDRAAFDAHWERILADPAVLIRTVLCDDEVAGSVLSFLRDNFTASELRAATDILDERLARGDISVDDYQRRHEALRRG